MPDENPYRRLAWALGIAGFVLLLLGGAMSAWSGRSMSGARNLLFANNAGLQSALLQKVNGFCREEIQQLPGGPQSAACKGLSLTGDKIPEDRVSPILDAAKACLGDVSKDACSTIWRAAVAVDQEQTWKKSFFGWFDSVSAYLTGPSPSAGSNSILMPFVVIVIGIAGLVIALGLGTKQRVAGVWIDTRNRVSLARAQVTLWTIVALAGYAAFAMFNIGFAGIISSSADLAKYGAFPGIPASIAAALGIAVGSPMLSALILPTKDKDGKQLEYDIRGADPDLSKRGVPFFGAASEGLDKRDSPAQASLADIFMGEEKANANTVDVARLQNVVITVTLVLGFFSILAGMTSTITAKEMLAATGPIFTSLPELGATFTSLLFVSHATYLVSKSHDANSPKPGNQIGSP
jgi:hypothetical protein